MTISWDHNYCVTVLNDSGSSTSGLCLVSRLMIISISLKMCVDRVTQVGYPTSYSSNLVDVEGNESQSIAKCLGSAYPGSLITAERAWFQSLTHAIVWQHCDSRATSTVLTSPSGAIVYCR